MPSKTIKIFLGNLADSATADVIKPLFEPHGKVVEADVIKNYGFVHMEDEADAKRAIAAINGKELHGKAMVVEMSTGLNKRGHARGGRCKIFVGNLPRDAEIAELRELFAQHGSVQEADIISNFAFIHMAEEAEALVAIEALNGHSLRGQEIRVQMSTSGVRQVPGMDRADMCFRCGSHGHWSKDCGRLAVGGGGGGYGAPAADYGGAYGYGARDRGRYAPYPAYAPPPPAYRRDPYADPYAVPRRDPYYEQRAYYDAYDAYEADLYDRRRVAALPPMHDPYGPPPRRYAPVEEPLYDRRAPAAPYSVPQPARRMY